MTTNEIVQIILAVLATVGSVFALIKYLSSRYNKLVQDMRTDSNSREEKYLKIIQKNYEDVQKLTKENIDTMSGVKTLLQTILKKK